MLTSIEIQTFVAIDICDAELARIVQALPQLQVLKLGAESDCSHDVPSRIALHVLESIAVHCPQMRYLALFFLIDRQLLPLGIESRSPRSTPSANSGCWHVMDPHIWYCQC